MDIKPIETLYNGYRFRSRLEARWAWNPEYKKRVSCQFKARQARFEHGECG